MKIAIIGAGAVALSSAALLKKRGFSCSVWSAIASERKELRDIGTVTCEGADTGTYLVDFPEDIAQCVDAADVVMLAAPAFAHDVLLKALVPHVRQHQLVIVNTATGLSSLVLCRQLATRGVRPTIVDLGTSICTSRISGKAKVRIAPLKPGVDIATIPANGVAEARKTLTVLFGDLFIERESALAIAVNNHNPVYHVPALIFNFSRAELAEDWNIWRDMTPFAADYIQRLDDERMAMASHFCEKPHRLADYVRSSIGVSGNNLPALFAAAAEKRPAPTGPKSIEDRYMTEDMPFGMVFFCSLGRAAKVPMPLSERLISFCCDLYGRDFAATGHTLSLVGLGDHTPAEILRIAREGF